MRALAEFAMRSRLHAIGASMATALLPLLGWVSTVIVALVVLRHGIPAGSLVLLWTLLPVGVTFHLFGDPLPSTMLVGSFLMAAVLRHSQSWPTLLVTAVLYAAFSLLMIQGYLINFLTDFLNRIELTPEPEAMLQLTPLFAFGQAIALVVMLILARWAQSALYKPGRFKAEFHQLRLSPGLGTSLGVVILACLTVAEPWIWWLPLFTLPLVVAALGLAHWYFARINLSKGWVAIFYVSLLILSEFSTLLLVLLAAMALLDTWFNIRMKVQAWGIG